MCIRDRDSNYTTNKSNQTIKNAQAQTPMRQKTKSTNSKSPLLTYITNKNVPTMHFSSIQTKFTQQGRNSQLQQQQHANEDSQEVKKLYDSTSRQILHSQNSVNISNKSSSRISSKSPISRQSQQQQQQQSQLSSQQQGFQIKQQPHSQLFSNTLTQKYSSVQSLIHNFKQQQQQQQQVQKPQKFTNLKGKHHIASKGPSPIVYLGRGSGDPQQRYNQTSMNSKQDSNSLTSSSSFNLKNKTCSHFKKYSLMGHESSEVLPEKQKVGGGGSSEQFITNKLIKNSLQKLSQSRRAISNKKVFD
eukprot:TRINITY_DN4981_c0_g1_i1.p1 TRINITY_DN4981_c0_g1~~TRINITY_DN4981_c0_g1_i1.p1  ORF type:complete len:318 (-),score=-38.42 TRINITY_DN4981_c0_g1_i1:36-941(-)